MKKREREIEIDQRFLCYETEDHRSIWRIIYTERKRETSNAKFEGNQSFLMPSSSVSLAFVAQWTQIYVLLVHRATILNTTHTHTVHIIDIDDLLSRDRKTVSDRVKRSKSKIRAFTLHNYRLNIRLYRYSKIREFFANHSNYIPFLFCYLFESLIIN